MTGSDTDALLFEAMAREGRSLFAAGDYHGAAAQLSQALALWHGQPLADVPRTPLVEAEAQRLNELRLGAVELRITAELACGGSGHAVAELGRLLVDHPMREGLWLLLMRALDGTGRHAEALETYGQAQAAISGQLGVEPGAELRQLYAHLRGRGSPGPADGITTAASAARGSGPGTESPLGGFEESRLMSARDFQALAPPPPPAQLPADIVDFTGRGKQVKRLCDLLSGEGEGEDASENPGAGRIAVVAGAGGLGKTSLAVHAAHHVRRKFPDGQLYIDLLGTGPDPLKARDALARFLRDLGAADRDIPVGEAERASRYRTTLARRRMLILLDNARDAAQIRPLLPGSASSAVLVTTRGPVPDLASSELIDLDVLGDDEALKLFIKVVDEERASAEPEATAELLDACAGLPLAIRICAKRLAERPGWTIQTMSDRLRDEHHRLDELRIGDLSVRASLPEGFASLPARANRHDIDVAAELHRRRAGLLPGSQGISAGTTASADDGELPTRGEQQKTNDRRGPGWEPISGTGTGDTAGGKAVAGAGLDNGMAGDDSTEDTGKASVNETFLTALRTILAAAGIVERDQAVVCFEALIHSWPETANGVIPSMAVPLAQVKEGERSRPRQAAIPDAEAGYSNLRPDPRGVQTPAELIEELRRFRTWAGNPSFRDMARYSGHRVGASTMCTLLKGAGLPRRLEVIDAIVEGCGGNEDDRQKFATAWRLLTMPGIAQTAGPPGPKPPPRLKAVSSTEGTPDRLRLPRARG